MSTYASYTINIIGNDVELKSISKVVAEAFDDTSYVGENPIEIEDTDIFVWDGEIRELAIDMAKAAPTATAAEQEARALLRVSRKCHWIHRNPLLRHLPKRYAYHVIHAQLPQDTGAHAFKSDGKKYDAGVFHYRLCPKASSPKRKTLVQEEAP